MYSFKCKLCERSRFYEKRPKKKTVIFTNIERLYNHVLRSPDPEHVYFRKRLKLPTRNHQKKLKIFKEAIEKEKHLWTLNRKRKSESAS